MSLLFTILQIILLIMFLKIKKTDKKENITLWITISIIILMCLNIFITLILNTMKIKSNLINLSIVYIIIIGVMIYNIIRTKEKQQYYVKKQDIIATLIILIITSAVTYCQYKIPFNIKYTITDGAVHYNAMVNFYEKSDLLKTVNLENFNTFMTGAYVNSGILLKSLSSVITLKDYFSVFVIFDVLLFFMAGEIFYFLIKKEKCSKKEWIFSICFALVYMLGYPLNSLLSGFSYLSLGLDIILMIMIFIKKYLKSEKVILINCMALLMLGLFFSYYYFVPIVYATVLIMLILQFRQEKRKININDIIKFIYICIIPSILGIFYMFIKEMFDKKYNIPTEVLKISGDIYQNFISNITLFIPFIIYYFINKNTRKQDIESKILFVLTFLFMSIMFIGNKIDYVSNYYFYKLYYIFWIPVVYLSYNGILELINSKKLKQIISNIVLIIYFGGLVTSIISNKNLMFWDIYYQNYKTIFSDRGLSYGNEFLDILQFYNDNLKNEKQEVAILATNTEGRSRWQYVLFQNPMLLYPDDELLSIEDWINNKTEKYLIYGKRDYNEEPKENGRYEIIMNNSEGCILKRL